MTDGDEVFHRPNEETLYLRDSNREASEVWKEGKFWYGNTGNTRFDADEQVVVTDQIDPGEVIWDQPAKIAA